MRRTLGAVLGGLALALLLGACEEAAAPKTAATPSQPAPEPLAQSTCVPDVKIHGTDTGGAIQGAIKESVLYWAGTESDVECVGEPRRQEQRVGNTEGDIATYRVIRVQEDAGDRYHILKYVNGEPVCIIDVTGACERKLSALGDYDVETLPETVPDLGGSETQPTPPPPTTAPATPGDTLFQERYVVSLADGTTTIINSLAAFFVDPEGGRVTITNVTSSSERIATVAMVNGNLQVTPVNVGTATVTISASSGSNPPNPQWGVKSVAVEVIP